MKKSFLILVLLAFFSCGRKPNEVVVVEKTKSYHTEECPKVMMAKTEIRPREEAQRMNCKPCKDCKPDSSKTGQ
jgi:hypothetical protein